MRKEKKIEEVEEDYVNVRIKFFSRLHIKHTLKHAHNHTHTHTHMAYTKTKDLVNLFDAFRVMPSNPNSLETTKFSME